MSQTIQLYTNKVTIEPEDDNISLVTINNINFDDIAPQFTAEYMMKAISDHYGFSTVFDIVMEMKGEDNE